MSYLGFNNFYMNSSLFLGGMNPFMSCCCNSFSSFNPGFGHGLFPNFTNMFSFDNYNLNNYMSFNQNYSFPSLFTTGNFNNNNLYNPSYFYSFPRFNYSNSFPDLSINNSFNYNFTNKVNSNSSLSNIPSIKKTNTVSKTSNIQNSYTEFKLDKAFINRVKEISKKINCDYKDLLAVMNSESGINPQKWNGTGAVGLIQFTNIALKDINNNYGTSYTKEQVGQMSGMEQLDLVEKFLTMVKKRQFSPDKKLSSGDLYAMVFAPSIAAKENLYTKGSDAYAQNPLDLDNDGVITKTDLANHLKRKQVNLVA